MPMSKRVIQSALPIGSDARFSIVLYMISMTSLGVSFRLTNSTLSVNLLTTIAAGTKGDVVLRARIERVEYEVQYRNTKNAANPNGDSYLFGDEVTLLPLEAAGFVGFVSYADPTLEVTTLTADFIVENEKRLFTGGVIALKAKWSEEE